MSKNKKLVESITSRDVDFSQWYTDLCLKAELMDYSNTKGFIIYRPLGYGIWENIQNYLNNEFRKTNHENVYMPLLIPESLFQKEKDHVEGFAPETAMVTTTGIEDLNERLIVRPTSEVLFSTHYSKIVKSFRDLPKKYNQWCSVVRWEKTTRPFLRGKEFLWQEGHTAHETKEEAMKETLDILKIYEKMGKDLLAIPFVTGMKTEKEKFAGAINTYAIEALMYDGQALQSGTTHYFGDEFAKAFDIKFLNENNELVYAHQTSWGVSTRLIGALIMVHGDDSGLVLPPYVAPTQVVIIPIAPNDLVLEKVKELEENLNKEKIRFKTDNSKRSPGWKFSEHEMKGTPIRIEIGPRDLKNDEVTIVYRHTREKVSVKFNEITNYLNEAFSKMHHEMYENAKKFSDSKTYTAKTYEDFKKYLKMGGYIKMSIAGEEAEMLIKEETGATSRVILNDELITKT